MKLTAVTISIKGRSQSFFIPLPVNEAGKVQMDLRTILAILGINVPRGTTISIG